MLLGGETINFSAARAMASPVNILVVAPRLPVATRAGPSYDSLVAPQNASSWKCSDGVLITKSAVR